MGTAKAQCKLFDRDTSDHQVGCPARGLGEAASKRFGLESPRGTSNQFSVGIASIGIRFIMLIKRLGWGQTLPPAGASQPDAHGACP